MRLELTTSGTTNQRSNQLSYIRQRITAFIFADFLKKVKQKNKDALYNLTKSANGCIIGVVII